MARHHRFSRYSRYTGGPDPLAPPVDLREALDEIGRDVMEGVSPRRALQEYLRRGSQDRRGLDKLAEAAHRRRQDLLRRNNLDKTFEDIRELLDEAVLTERRELARALDDDARFQEMRIENLPPSPAQAVRELSDYAWRSPEGREKFERIKDLMGRELLDQQFAGMKEALENATDEDRRRVQEMLDDLNSLLDKHNRGEDTDQDFAEFMDEHGEFFPDNPRNVDELIDSLAKRAAAAQRLRNSLTSEQRAELDQLAQSAFGTPSLSQALNRLGDALQQARPGEDWYGSEDFEGQQGMGLGDATGAMADIAELDDLIDQLSQQHQGASMDDIDLEALARQLGEDTAVDAQALKELERALRDAGYFEREPDGALRLSPKAIRQLGQSILRDVAQQLSARGGERATDRAGIAGEPTGASREWRFGDVQPWDTTRTVVNAVLRQSGSGAPRDGSVRLDARDIEVVETEARSRAAVALLVDTSFSMVMEGRWVPMKRTALALHQLISTRFRGDELTVIGFGRHARTLTAAELTGLDGVYEQGTNLHHALLLAGDHFRRHSAAQPVLLVVTDGEPTAHLERDGEAFFGYPPHPRTLALTVRGFDAVAAQGAQTTIFQLGDEPSLTRFLDLVARRVGGRLVNPDLDGLGAAVVSDYLGSRRRR
ncbi:VWA domain-containing protein [Tsukamurella sp. 8F]|uniref:vWA domain-containing protein n=1 Tax=unclassified Tsukamurella TaxID=2633480 RepID=UPI0023B8957D|nr:MULTISPECIES: VWA domain-containing protein [unclassified Tsukamurella]MDF0532520.1 VWA domain-containing protein [Tsukamurella sp. 8J]MDF0589406.1 VWA domain-containing protein [Tsukamurella sp. 8F]